MGKPAGNQSAGHRIQDIAWCWRDLVLIVASLLIGLLVIEIGFRLVSGLPVFSLKDWRQSGAVFYRLGDRALPDTKLGWKLRPSLVSADFNTLPEGVRKNSKETALRTGEILAVGDSFTEGWEDVADNGTWPAQLEARLGRAVVNGGVGGYGSDQVALWTEQLLPIVRPKVLIFGLNETGIYRAGHSPFGAPKPYFTLSADRLQFHAPKPIETEEKPDPLVWAGLVLRDFLARSAVANELMSRLLADFWYYDSRQVYARIDNDPADVTCKLLKRLKKLTDQDGIRLILFMQYNAWVILERDKPTEDATRVMACARSLNIEVIDHFPTLKELADSDMRTFTGFYTRHGEEFGHMTAAGNAHAAALVAHFLEN